MDKVSCNEMEIGTLPPLTNDKARTTSDTSTNAKLSSSNILVVVTYALIEIPYISQATLLEYLEQTIVSIG